MIFDVNQKLQKINFDAFQITSLGKCELSFGLQLAKDYFSEDGNSNYAVLIRNQIEKINAEYGLIGEYFLNSSVNISNVYEIPSEYYSIAKKFCFIQMSIACLNIWISNKNNENLFLKDESWLFLCLNKILVELNLPEEQHHLLIEAKSKVFAKFEELHNNNQLFAVFPFEIK